MKAAWIAGCAWTALAAAARPRLVVRNDGTNGSLDTTIANDLLSFDLGRTFGTRLMFGGRDLVGNATGAYASYDGAVSNLNYTSATVAFQTETMLDVAYNAAEGSVHFVLFTGLPGFYSYFVNAALGTRGEFRTLYRLAPPLFPDGRTYLKDEPLPRWTDILTSVKVQDETWQRADGTYITKYDNAFFARASDFHGVHGDAFGAWVLNPGKDYLNGDQLKQELSVHRESGTGDTVLLNMLHGTHYETASSGVNFIPPGKVFGPWLVYLNNGSVADAAARYAAEARAWPYAWFNRSDAAFHSRGTVTGRLVLDSGAPASGAAVFLGDPGKTLSQGSAFQYTTTAAADGSFTLADVRTEKAYTLQAWPAGGALAHVTTTFAGANSSVTVAPNATTALGTLRWPAPARAPIWQIGAFDRTARGFAFGGAPHTHGLVDLCPADLDFAVGASLDAAWCFGKSAAGTWTVHFGLPAGGNASAAAAGVLSLSLAGFSGSGSALGGVGSALEVWVNGRNLGDEAAPPDTDPGLYRSGTAAGEWHYFELAVPAGVLVAGANAVQLVTTNATAARWRGVMWDMVKLEWE